MVSEAKAVAALVCGTSHSGFDSRQTPSRKMPLNGRQLVLKTRVQVTVKVRFLHLPFFPYLPDADLSLLRTATKFDSWVRGHSSIAQSQNTQLLTAGFLHQIQVEEFT
jgi:hypothetical protein